MLPINRAPGVTYDASCYSLLYSLATEFPRGKVLGSVDKYAPNATPYSSVNVISGTWWMLVLALAQQIRQKCHNRSSGITSVTLTKSDSNPGTSLQ